jgi:hypothetical protein
MEPERETYQLRKISVQNWTENARLALINCFLSVFICIDLAQCNNMSSIIVNNTERNWRKTIKASLAFSVQFWTEIFRSWQVSLRPSVLRHVMYTIVDQYRDTIYDNERETWSKSTRGHAMKVELHSTFLACARDWFFTWLKLVAPPARAKRLQWKMGFNICWINDISK